MEVYEWGHRENPTIVCLHGMGSTGLSFGELANLLLPDFHVVAFDLPGHGSSEPLSEELDYRPGRLAERIAAAIEKLGKSKVYLMGHSWGAHLALFYAKDYPVQIEGVILLDGGYFQLEDRGNALKKELENVEAFYETVRFPSWEAFIESEKSELPRWSDELEAASRAQVIEKDGEIRLKVTPFTCKAVLKGIYAEPIGSVFSQIHTPVLLLRSTLPSEMEDSRQEAAHKLHTEIPDAEVHPIADTTHDIYRDAPAETAKIIKNWVSRRKD
ncbi:MAG TPA: alpha/beta hydrolase [Bacillales bacterium]|nr:alpha/beta hydrolase [Bacillales bacterium]